MKFDFTIMRYREGWIKCRVSIRLNSMWILGHAITHFLLCTRRLIARSCKVSNQQDLFLICSHCLEIRQAFLVSQISKRLENSQHWSCAGIFARSYNEISYAILKRPKSGVASPWHGRCNWQLIEHTIEDILTIHHSLPLNNGQNLYD